MSDEAYAFVTVGTTRFDALVRAVLAPDFAHACLAHGVRRVRLQIGNSALPDGVPEPGLAPVGACCTHVVEVSAAGGAAGAVVASSGGGGGAAVRARRSASPRRRRPELRAPPPLAGAATVTFEIYRFKPSLRADVDGAQFVVSHAGAGSIFEALRALRPLLVVVNADLADNHQRELAEAMAGRGHCRRCEPAGLVAALRGADFGSLQPLPSAAPGASAFVTAVDALLADGTTR
jgi:UDP-N-acetylglucosamine transferase subunit ALG13